jgi:nicotinate phosphoribosyltransferase
MKETARRLAEGILSTDFYQLSAAQVYFRQGIHEQTAQFDHFFRSYPDYGRHAAGFCIHAGTEWLLDWMEDAHFGEEELGHLRAHRGRNGQPLFADDFLGWLRHHGHFGAVTLQSIPEGRVVHPHTPLTVVEAPLAIAQILETPLLLHQNFQTLIATKAARVRLSGEGRLLLEFGARRAHERAAHAGARAALIGGADFTSNSGISYVLGETPKGTHAHSMVQAFLALGGSELDAFRAFAEVYPDDCLLLVDTVDTLGSGVPNAIRVFEELRGQGHEPVGIRLDSGDLAHLAVRAARMLDDAGFPGASIVLSNQLDELVILQILTQIRAEAREHGLDPEAVVHRLIYGVGTALITSRGDGALDGVYKLTALKHGDEWRPVLKLSESVFKIPHPGRKELWRLYDRDGRAAVDLLTCEGEDPRAEPTLPLHHAVEEGIFRRLPQSEISRTERLHETVYDRGRRSASSSLAQARQRREQDLASLHPGVKRIVNPHRYHVSLSESLFQTKRELVKGLRGTRDARTEALDEGEK